MVRKACLLAALGLLGASWPGTAQADVTTARAMQLRGDYEGAAQAYGEAAASLRGAERENALIAQSENLRLLGRLAKAKSVLGAARTPETAVAKSELQALAGDYRGALETIRVAHKKAPTHPGLALALAKAHLAVGQKDKAQPLLQDVVDREQAGKLDTKDADTLFLIAEAGRLLGHFQYANETYREAVGRKRDFFAANLSWGKMFLAKYAPGHASTSFQEILSTDPRHPDAHAGMARVLLEEKYDIANAMLHVQQALDVNPGHADALLVQATIEIDRNQWSLAQKTLKQVLQTNPRHLEALSMQATIAWLRDQLDTYDALKKRVLSINPSYAEFFHIVARSAVREHRYAKAIELEKEAVALNPDYFEAMQAVGTGYMRLGLEKTGLEWLERAYKGDKYNVRTVNTLQLFDEKIPKEYEFKTTEHFKIRLHREEAEILGPLAATLLESAFVRMEKRYGFSPKTPIIVELYRSREDYSVRTVGLPNLGALGVCFGQVITALSPSTGDLNWAMVLWHELAHVFAIQLSQSRVPRWYTEGLSEYETVLARPEWRRENDADIHGALVHGTLPSVAELNFNFMKPDQQTVSVAYHTSSVTIEYIAETHGFDAIVQGLRLFGQGKETPEVIESITGKRVADFDQAFRSYLKRRLTPFFQSWPIPTALGSIEELRANAEKDPTDADSWARLAMGHFFDGNASAARNAAKKALDRDPKSKLAHYVAGEIALRTRQTAAAKKHFEQLIKIGGDNPDVRGRLATLAKGNVREAEKHLCAAKQLSPESSFPYQELNELYQRTERPEEAKAELETYVFIEQMEYAPARKAFLALTKASNWRKARAFGELARDINPFDGELYLALGKTYVELGDVDAALTAFDAALAVRPRIRRPAVAHLGKAQAHLSGNKKTLARKEVEAALRFEPENLEALKLREQL